LQDAALAFVVFLAFAAPPSVKFTPFVLKLSSFKFAPVSSAWFVFSASLAFFRICVAFASSVRVAFGVTLSFIALVAANGLFAFGTLFVSIVPIAAGVVLAPVAPIAASAPSVPLAFSALLVAICSQAKARFSLEAERLNLALVAAPMLVVFLALTTPPSVKFKQLALKQFSFKFAPSFASASLALFVFSGALAFFRICVAFSQAKILSPAVVAEILPHDGQANFAKRNFKIYRKSASGCGQVS